MSGRNAQMAARVEGAPARYPFSFVVAGDSGAWPDPTAEAIFGQLVRQVAALDPAPVFFANLGDFAGPGSHERHRRYLELADGLPCPHVCLVGNHDLDDAQGDAAWAAAHGERNFTWAHGHTRFVAIDGASGFVDDAVPTAGPEDEALRFLDDALAAAREPHRVVLLHIPPHLGAHFAPHAEWGFSVREPEFRAIVGRHGVALVCCAHGLAFDTSVHDGVRYVMSGGGGTALCSHLHGVCAAGLGRPEDRGALFHAVQIVVAESGAISGRVLQAFAAPDAPPRMTF